MEVRLDKWLWAVRVYKTRSDAAEACRTGRVTVNGSQAKPSRDVKQGDTVTIRKGVVTYTCHILQPVSNRLPARDVPSYMEDRTPQSELDKLLAPRQTVFVTRERGAGRPTKKERREIDTLMDDISSLYDDED